MKKLDLIQGSDEWVSARMKYFCASEAAAMLGFDKKLKRNELLHMKSTGFEREFSEWVREHLLEKGHEVEALARPIVEDRLGESLDQIVAISDDGRLLASYDGMTMMDDRTWENKLMNKDLMAFINLNDDLPDTHWPQCEHQSIVSDGAPVYFTLSDGTEEGTVGIWYKSKPERREQVLAGWKQFEEDLKNYVPVEVIPAAVATPTLDLPMVSIKTSGNIAVISNLKNFGAALNEFIEKLPTRPSNDQEFADCKAAIGKLKLAEETLDSEETRALSLMEEFAEMRREKQLYFDLSRKTRLALEKLVTAREQAIKIEIAQEAKEKLAEHVANLNKRLGARLMPEPVANFAEAMKNKRTISSLQNSVDTELSRAKIASSAIADRIDINQKAMAEAEAAFLFPDFANVCLKANDDFSSLIAARQATHRAAEETRLEAEREKIRAEEQANAQREAAEKAAAEKREADAKAAAEKAEQDRIDAEAIRKLDEDRRAAQTQAAADALAALPKIDQVTPSLDQVIHAVVPEQVASAISPAPTLKLGDITSRLGFTVTAEFLSSLGFEPETTEKNAKLYRSDHFPVICRFLIKHIEKVANEAGETLRDKKAA